MDIASHVWDTLNSNVRYYRWQDCISSYLHILHDKCSFLIYVKHIYKIMSQKAHQIGTHWQKYQFPICSICSWQLTITTTNITTITTTTTNCCYCFLPLLLTLSLLFSLLFYAHHNKSLPNWATQEVIGQLTDNYHFRLQVQYGQKDIARLRGGNTFRHKPFDRLTLTTYKYACCIL